MSIEASKWARLADVQKSSSKLVLLNLAQLVHYQAEEWTVFASIEYLVSVTHLNRKTVIEALSRLRELGAIQDTGKRAGDNRSSIIYRLCPDGVPQVKLSGKRAAGADAAERRQQCADAGNETSAPPCAGGATASDGDVGASFVGLSPAIDAHTEPSSPSSEHVVAAAALQHEADAAQLHQPPGRRAGVDRRSGAGAAPTRLPEGWVLPGQWRAWTKKQRPHWADEKIDAIAATFSAYKRSQPGDAGCSSDWFETWRLWVFREWDGKENGKSWQNSWSGIVAKGKELGLQQEPNELAPYFKVRVFQAAGLPPP